MGPYLKGPPIKGIKKLMDSSQCNATYLNGNKGQLISELKFDVLNPNNQPKNLMNFCPRI